MKKLASLLLFLALIFGGAVIFVYKDFIFEKINNLSASEAGKLRLENESLKAIIASSSLEKKDLKINNLIYKEADVFSFYPFNSQKLIEINLGSDDGVVKSMAVAAAPEMLLGQVVEVYQKYSVVRTVFDPDFKLAVRVGDSLEDALFQGGNSPIVNMISKKSRVGAGDSVYSAGSQFPYRLKLGVAGELSDVKGSFFQQAEVKFSYSLNDLKKVYVITNYAK